MRKARNKHKAGLKIGSGNLGNHTPLDKDQCAYFIERGQWSRECPKKKTGPSKVAFTLEEED